MTYQQTLSSEKNIKFQLEINNSGLGVI